MRCTSASCRETGTCSMRRPLFGGHQGTRTKSVTAGRNCGRQRHSETKNKMTPRQITSRLRADLKEHFDDSVLYNRHLWNAFWTSTRVLLQREADANKLKDQMVFSSYNLDTEEVNLYEGSCVPLECISCRVKFPKPVMAKKGPIYSFVGSPDLSVKYTIVDPQEFVVKSKIKGVRERYAFLEGDYLYLSKCIPCVKVLVAPEDDATTIDGKPVCGILDQEVVLPNYLIEGGLALAKESMMVFLRKAYDPTANKNEQQ